MKTLSLLLFLAKEEYVFPETFWVGLAMVLVGIFALLFNPPRTDGPLAARVALSFALIVVGVMIGSGVLQ